VTTLGLTHIEREEIELPSIYFAHRREVFRRGGMWLTAGDWGGPEPGELESVQTRSVRYRTVGDGKSTLVGRLPVQYVLQPQSPGFRDYRGYAGQVTAGTFAPGDQVLVLPSDRRTSVAGIDRLGAKLTTGRGSRPRHGRASW
jgi:hypothetical protein